MYEVFSLNSEEVWVMLNGVCEVDDWFDGKCSDVVAE